MAVGDEYYSASAGGGAEDDRRHHDSHDDHAGHDDHEGHDHAGHDDHDDHGHGGHDHAHDLRGSSRRSLIFALVLISSYMVAEVIGGIASGSLALLADAGHMATDAAAIGLALFAMWIADREASIERTYGYYRTEILAALLNALALWLIVGWILFEAYHQFEEFHRRGASELHIDGWLMMGVGIGGLLVNLGAAWILHRSSEHSLNVEGAFRHVMADLLGSVGVVLSGIVVLSTGWTLIDPILSVVIALLIMFSTWHLVMKVFHVLLEGTPEHIDVYKLCSQIEDMEGVTLNP